MMKEQKNVAITDLHFSGNMREQRVFLQLCPSLAIPDTDYFCKLLIAAPLGL